MYDSILAEVARDAAQLADKLDAMANRLKTAWDIRPSYSLQSTINDVDGCQESLRYVAEELARLLRRKGMDE